MSGLNGAKSKGSHSGAATRFLTGFGANSSAGAVLSSTSIDQLVAKEFARHTQLASLELSLDGREEAGSCDANPCGMSNTISWHSPTLPMPMENNPRVVFERLFGDVGSTDSKARLARLKRDRSILDSVTQAAADLGRQLGPGDRARLDEYLDGVRGIEARIQKAEEQSATELPLVAQPAGVPAGFDDYAKLMFDLQVLAYQVDLTRVITFMMGREFSGRSYPEVGVPRRIIRCRTISTIPRRSRRWPRSTSITSRCSPTTSRSCARPGTATVRCSITCCCIYGAGMSDSNAHDPNNLPILLMGGADQFKGGRHLKYAGDSAANLLVTVMDKLGVPVERVGTSTGKLSIDTLSDV